MSSMSNFLQSSNPALNNEAAFREAYGQPSTAAARPDVATFSGVVNKTSLLVLLAVIAGSLAYAFIPVSATAVNIGFVASMVIVLGVGFMICGNPKLAVVAGPIYAVVEGIALGLFTALLDRILISMDSMQSVTAAAAADGGRISLAMPAFLVTISATLAMLGLYYTGLVKPTKKFRTVLYVMGGGIMLVYLLSWPLALFGISIPFVSLNSAMQGGTAALIGLGISVLFLGVASFFLILDFGRAAEIVNSGQPKYMEWYAAFGILVTLAWIYYEAVKLVFRLYLIFGSRD